MIVYLRLKACARIRGRPLSDLGCLDLLVSVDACTVRFYQCRYIFCPLIESSDISIKLLHILLCLVNAGQQGQPGAAPFAVGELRVPDAIRGIVETLRGIVVPQQQPAQPVHAFDDDDEYLDDILAQFPDADEPPPQ